VLYPSGNLLAYLLLSTALIQTGVCDSPQVIEAAVLGLPSDQWGQKVAAVVVLNEEDAKAGGRGGKPWGLMDMRRALKDKLASYKLPQEMKVVPNGLPRNAMGKGRLSFPVCFVAPLLTCPPQSTKSNSKRNFSVKHCDDRPSIADHHCVL
jgi:hypothetical protein